MTYEDLLSLLAGLHPETDFASAEGLIENKYLTSFDMIFLAGELADTYELELEAADITPENFFSAKTLFALIQRKEAE